MFSVGLFRCLKVIKLILTRIFLMKCIFYFVKSVAWKSFSSVRTLQLSAKYRAIASQCRSAMHMYQYHVELVDVIIIHDYFQHRLDTNGVINWDNIDRFYCYLLHNDCTAGMHRLCL